MPNAAGEKPTVSDIPERRSPLPIYRKSFDFRAYVLHDELRRNGYAVALAEINTELRRAGEIERAYRSLLARHRPPVGPTPPVQELGDERSIIARVLAWARGFLTNRTFTLVSLLIVFQILGPTGLMAQVSPGDDFQLLTFTPCWGNADFCAPRILIEGTLPPDAGERFGQFWREHWLPEHPFKPTVCFNSPGGSIAGGLALGHQLREQKLDTCLESSYSAVGVDGSAPDVVLTPTAMCASACVFAFMGGVNRSIADGSHVGIHRFSVTTGSLGDDLTQVTQTVLAQYLDEMGVARSLLDAASMVPSSGIRWLSVKESRSAALDNMTPSSSDWTLDSANGVAVATISYFRPGPRNTISLSLLMRGDIPLAIVSLRLGNQLRIGNQKPEDIVDALNGIPVTLAVDGRIIGDANPPTWQKSDEQTLWVELRLVAKAAEALSAGSVLQLQTKVPHVYEDYDASFRVPLVGLKRHIPVILRSATTSLANEPRQLERPGDRLAGGSALTVISMAGLLALGWKLGHRRR